MRKFILNTFLFLILLSADQVKAQEHTSILFTKENILKFADYLFAERDYLRAVMEYRRYLENNPNDTIRLKIADSYLNMSNFEEARSEYMALLGGPLTKKALTGYGKSFFFNRDYSAFQTQASLSGSEQGSIVKMKYLSFLFSDTNLPEKNDFLSYFPEYSHNELNRFYDRKKNPEYKSELKAVLLSAVLPGAGKIYTGNYGDGITALIITSLLGYISYDNFNAGHDLRGWIFAGLGTLFYSGNIYGSAAAVQIYNSRILMNYRYDLDLFLKDNNYFLSDD